MQNKAEVRLFGSIKVNRFIRHLLAGSIRFDTTYPSKDGVVFRGFIGMEYVHHKSWSGESLALHTQAPSNERILRCVVLRCIAERNR
mmetsp:Transcript_11950/g.25263  ORF Transcript_11950/g.25263 Transcript_11950/m.25263 type:complete len:87 (-) Transcript_11950:11-271(-)